MRSRSSCCLNHLTGRRCVRPIESECIKSENLRTQNDGANSRRRGKPRPTSEKFPHIKSRSGVSIPCCIRTLRSYNLQHRRVTGLVLLNNFTSLNRHSARRSRLIVFRRTCKVNLLATSYICCSLEILSASYDCLARESNPSRNNLSSATLLRHEVTRDNPKNRRSSVYSGTWAQQ